MGTGLRQSSGSPAAPPYTNGPYTWDAEMTFEGAVTVNGDFSFGDAGTDRFTILDNGVLQFEGVSGDNDGMTLNCDSSGDATIEVTAGKLTINTSDNVITATGEALTVGTLSDGTASLTGGNLSGVGTATATSVQVTNVKAHDGTASIVITDSTGAVAISKPTTISNTLAVSGKMEFGGVTDWGTGATGVVVDGTGYDWASQTIARVNSNLNNTAAAAAYHANTVTASQTSSNSVFGTWTELYISGASVDLTGSDNYASVWGNLEISGASTISTDSDNFMSAIHGSITTPSGYTNNTAFCGCHVDSNVNSTVTNNTRFSAFECNKTAGSRNWDYGVYLDDTTTGIYMTAPTTAGIVMPGGASYNPLHIGVKSNSADAGLILVGGSDDPGGIMVFCDDGNDTLSNVTSPVWTRYLITKNQGTGGPTATGAFFQSKSLTGLTFTTGSYTALKAYYQIGGTLALAGSATELAIMNAGVTLEGELTVGSGNRFSGIDININDGGHSIVDTALDSAALHIRKTSGSTAGWPVGIKINSVGATTGIQMVGGAAFVPVLIGAKSSSAGYGVKLAGDTDNSGGVQIYADDGGAALTADVAAGLRSRTLITYNHTSGHSIFGTFSQMVTAASLTLTSGNYGAAYIFNQVGANLTLATGAQNFALNLATTVGAGTYTVGAGCIFAGIDVNIRGTGVTITNNGTCAGVLIRKLETITWPVGLEIGTSAAATGIKIGTTSGACIHMDGGADGSAEGDFWYDVTAHVLKYRDNSGIKTITASS